MDTERIVNQTHHYNKETSTHLNGAVFIDKEGNEIPITEAMIQNACKNLHDAWDNDHCETNL